MKKEGAGELQAKGQVIIKMTWSIIHRKNACFMILHGSGEMCAMASRT